MNHRTKIFMAVLFVIFMTSIVAAFGGILGGDDLTTQNVLVCPVDDSGACNVAFLISIENGKISNYTSVSTEGMDHPTVADPNNANEKLSFHDALTLDDKEQGLNYAKEIYEANNDGVTIDGAAAVDSKIITDVIAAAGTLKDGDNVINPTAADLISPSSLDSVKPICDALLNAAKDPQQSGAMYNAAFSDYKSGDVTLTPHGFFAKLAASYVFGGLFA
ncbi:DUF4012 domain-containing protein [Methanobrevibacter sp.]|uniref:DUF4012 domain-containing protein n=1 Tax=Methanobrevibacter sp. TaxID=66852 RepID=UPI0025FE4F06|nr:DUF4012 domain-containing protein [Methanobrevibacter sp.]MBQ2961987.1 DUF4012 domain-containing protein [Methanobrevibacter sp.]